VVAREGKGAAAAQDSSSVATARGDDGTEALLNIVTVLQNLYFDSDCILFFTCTGNPGMSLNRIYAKAVFVYKKTGQLE
jgi:hypothetical protein